MLNNNLNKMDIAGIIAAGIGVTAGLGIALYTHFKCKKESKEMEQIMETVSDCSEELNELLKQTAMIDKGADFDGDTVMVIPTGREEA